MKSKINSILSEIDKKKNELKVEYHKLMVKYGFTFSKGKIIFNSNIIKTNKKYKKSIYDSIFNAKIREILSMPFIYAMLFPAIFLDLMLFIYQQTAVRLYGIPFVVRKDYIIFDRGQLDYLNFLQKMNCMFCTYVNGLFAYATEIGGRTERYWCPIKHAKKTAGSHEREKHFADYGDAEGFKETFCKDNNTYKK
ncbi:MAG: hypothetical protein QM490_05275 [Candidatus Gracilibacteria bacterium]